MKPKQLGQGTKAYKGKILYQSICNHGGCYQDATSSYGFCVEHIVNQKLDKDGSWIHNV